MDTRYALITGAVIISSGVKLRDAEVGFAVLIVQFFVCGMKQ